MACTMFGAIDVGSYEINLKIYELSARRGIREINHVKHRIELGKDTYATGRIGSAMVDELCLVLQDFQRIMKEFGVEQYRACATSAIRETKNMLILLDRIYQRTGIRLEVLSNSEQRFLGYKSIAYNSERFQQIIEKGTAIVDVGGGSIQISLFDKDNLVTTQNIRLGTLRLRERLSDVAQRTIRYSDVLEEIMNNELRTYRRLYLKDRNIRYLMLVGDYIDGINRYIHRDSRGDQISREEFITFYDTFMQKDPKVMMEELGISQENSSLLLPTLVIYKRLLEETGAEKVVTVGMDLGDGLAYDFAEQQFGLYAGELPESVSGRVAGVGRNLYEDFPYLCRLAHRLLLFMRLMCSAASASISSFVFILPPESHWSISLRRKRSFLPSLCTGMRFWQTQS